MDEDIEILVHGSAPGRPSDEAKYRRQAQGFLEHFVSSQETVDTSDTGLEPKSDARDATTHGAGACVALPRQGNAAVSRAPHTSDAPSQDSSHSAPKPSPTIFVTRTPYLDRVKSDPVPAADDTPTHSRHSRSKSHNAAPCFVPDSQPDFFKAPPSVVQDSQPLDSSQRKRAREQSSSSMISALKAAAGIPDSQESNKRRRLDPESSSCLPASDRRTPPLPATTPTSHRTVSTPGRGGMRTIKPSPPPTSVSSFSTHATRELLDFVGSEALGRCYSPAAARAIRPFERGCWRVRINRALWTTEALAEFWDFLSQFLEEGRAGWATWVEREPVDDGEELRLWCWGAVVKEMWLVLFVASGRLVKKVGAQWVDARGQVAVRMEDK